MTKEQKRELKSMCSKLAKSIGPGIKISAAETDRRWHGWKSGRYDPTTGVWS